MTLEDITNDCRYIVHHCSDGKIMYNIQAEEKNCWRTIALYKDDKLSCTHEFYPIKFDVEGMKIYRIGKMRY